VAVNRWLRLLTYSLWAVAVGSPQWAFAQSCPHWTAPFHPALADMHACHGAPISRQLGSVCTEVRWLCSHAPIKHWLDRLFTDSQSKWFIHPHGKGLVLADWSNQDDTSLVVFWEPGQGVGVGEGVSVSVSEGEGDSTRIDSSEHQPTQIMLSRFRPANGASIESNHTAVPGFPNGPR